MWNKSNTSSIKLRVRAGSDFDQLSVLTIILNCNQPHCPFLFACLCCSSSTGSWQRQPLDQEASNDEPCVNDEKGNILGVVGYDFDAGIGDGIRAV